MISLNVYLTPKNGHENALEKAIKEVWIAAMVKQPGFVSATLNNPFSDEDLEALEASKPSYVYEMVSYWATEEERVAWVDRDIHQEVWPQIIDQVSEVSYTLFDCNTTWNM